jgi:hypothetical protein
METGTVMSHYVGKSKGTILELSEGTMKKQSCIQCRYCRVKLSLWVTVAMIAVSVGLITTGVVTVSV